MNLTSLSSRPALRTAVLATLSSSLLLTACSKPEEPKPLAQPVLVVTAHNASASSDRAFPATIQARHESELSFRTGGKVIARLVNVGDFVRAGQALARLDESDNALSASAAADTVTALKAEATQAATDAARAKRLRADGSVSAAEDERLSAQAESLKAKLQQAQRQAGVAHNRLGYATLVAPFDGVVTSSHIEAGQVVTEGQSILSIARNGEPEVVADLPEQLLDQARNDEVSATLWAHPETRLKLHLRELSPIASTGARTYRARYSISDTKALPASTLALGMTAELSLHSKTASNSTWLPAGAVWKTDGKASVWLVDSAAGKLAAQPVQVQGYTAEAVQVAGLKDGSLVAAAGVQKLNPSMKVRAVSRTLSGTSGG
ncbi:MAG: efflux RND transporter periplasmic adaptor subunit [Pseudomonadota bacterium]